MIKTLVIGSKGFIGSHLFKSLSAQGEFEVWGSDVVYDYTSHNYFVIDASNSDFEEIFEVNQFEFCINCSGSASVPDSLIHPLRDFYLNTVNVFKLLEAIRKYSPKCKFLNISSAAVYGNPVVMPITENADLRPLSPYGQHKLQAENICMEFHLFHQLKTCSVRIFSAYGRDLKKQVFWDIAQKSIKSKKMTLFGTGEESRDFIHVDDIVYGIECILKKGEYDGAVYNLANSIEVTIADAAAELLNSLGWQGELTFTGQSRKGDPLKWRADITRLKALGYEQKISISEGLKDYVKWLKEEKLV